MSMLFAEVVVKMDGVSTICRGGGSQGSEGSSWCHCHSMVVGHPGVGGGDGRCTVAASLMQMARWWWPHH